MALLQELVIISFIVTGTKNPKVGTTEHVRETTNPEPTPDTRRKSLY